MNILKYFLIAIFLFFPHIIHAQIEENFDDLNVGYLNNQNGWSTSCGLSPQMRVTDVLYYSPYHSMRGVDEYGYACASKDFAVTPTGQQTVKFFPATGTGGNPIIFMITDAAGSAYCYVDFANGTLSGVKAYIESETSYLLTDNITLGEWHTISIQWQSSTHQCRAKIDQNLWSEWHNRVNSGTDPAKVLIDIWQNYTFFFDNISENASSNLLSFSTPNNGEYIPTGSYLFSGNCTKNGVNELALSDSLILGGEYHNGVFVPLSQLLNFTHNCSDGIFTATSTIDVGLRAKYVYDRDWLAMSNRIMDATSTSYIAYNGYVPGSLQWALQIIWPENHTWQNVYTVQLSNNFPFKISYSLPDTTLATSTIFSLDRLASSNSTTTELQIMHNSLLYFDPDENGFLQTNGIEASTTPTYYAAYLQNGDEIEYQLYFSVQGVSDMSYPSASQYPNNNSDLGLIGNALRLAFVPRKKYLNDFITDIPNALRSKIPFSYFYQISDIFSQQNATSTQVVLNLDFTIPLVGTVKMPFINTNENNLSNFLASIRPFLVGAMWIMFAIYLFERVADFDI